MIINLMLPYIAFVILFNYYAIYQLKELFDHSDDYTNIVLLYINRIILVIFNLYYLINEYVKLKNESSALKYFANVWNYVDIIPNMFCLIAIILSFISVYKDATSSTAHWQRYLNAFASFFTWLKFLYFFRVFRSFGFLIKAILEVIKESRVFLTIILFTILAFSGTYLILSRNDPQDGGEYEVPNYFLSIMDTYEIMLDSFSNNYGPVGYYIQWFVFVVSSILLVIIMINLYIAIISNIFGNVQSQSTREMYQEFAQLITENSHLISDKEKLRKDNQGNFLFCSQIQTTTDEGEDIIGPEGLVCSHNTHEDHECD